MPSCICLQCTAVAHTKYLYALWPQSFYAARVVSKVLSAAGKPRYIRLWQSRPYQPRACFLFSFSSRVDPILRWPALKVAGWPTAFNSEIYEGIGSRISHSSSQFCKRHWDQKALLYIHMHPGSLVESSSKASSSYDELPFIRYFDLSIMYLYRKWLRIISTVFV